MRRGSPALAPLTKGASSPSDLLEAVRSHWVAAMQSHPQKIYQSPAGVGERDRNAGWVQNYGRCISVLNFGAKCATSMPQIL